RPGVVVDERDDLTRSSFDPAIPRGGETFVRRRKHAKPELGCEGAGSVGRPVVDDDHFVVRVVELGERLEAGAKCGGAAVAADDDRDARPVDIGPEGNLPERAAHGGEGRFRSTASVDETEIPILDLGPGAVPRVGPREDEGAGTAAGEGGSQ